MIYHPYLLLRPGVMVADDTLQQSVNSRKLDMMTDSEMLPATLCRSLAQVNMRTLEVFYTKA